MKLYYDAAYGLLFICAGLGIGYFDAYKMVITLIGSMLLLIAIIFLLGIPFMILINFGIGLVWYVSQYDEW